MDTRCNRKIPSTELVHNDPEVREWFVSLIEMLERDAAIDQHKRISVLREVFSRGVLERILSIITVESRKVKGSSEEETESTWSSSTPLSMSTQMTSKREDRHRFFQRQSRASLRLSRISKSIYAKPKRASKRMFDFRHPVRPNPYLAFFKKKAGLASIWRGIPSVIVEKLSLGDKADVVSERIAAEFINWLKDNDLLEETLHVKSLLEMFEVGNALNVALRVSQKTLRTVPDSVAKFVGDTSQSVKEVLYREVLRDYRASFKKPQVVAFGRTIPAHMQKRPADRNYFERLLKMRIPDKLATGEAVWKGILDLKSTRDFSSYMAKNYPEVVPPRYLQEAGLMDIKEERRNSPRVSQCPQIMRYTIYETSNE